MSTLENQRFIVEETHAGKAIVRDRHNSKRFAPFSTPQVAKIAAEQLNKANAVIDAYAWTEIHTEGQPV